MRFTTKGTLWIRKGLQAIVIASMVLASSSLMADDAKAQRQMLEARVRTLQERVAAQRETSAADAELLRGLQQLDKEFPKESLVSDLIVHAADTVVDKAVRTQIEKLLSQRASQVEANEPVAVRQLWSNQVVLTSDDWITGVFLQDGKVIWATAEGVFRRDIEGGVGEVLYKGPIDWNIGEWDFDGNLIAYREGGKFYFHHVVNQKTICVSEDLEFRSMTMPRVSNSVQVFGGIDAKNEFEVYLSWYPEGVVPPRKEISADFTFPIPLAEIREGRVAWCSVFAPKFSHCNLTGPTNECSESATGIEFKYGVNMGPLYMNERFLVTRIVKSMPGPNAIYAYDFETGQGGILVDTDPNYRLDPKPLSPYHFMWEQRVNQPFTLAYLWAMDMNGEKSRINIRPNCRLAGRSDEAGAIWVRKRKEQDSYEIMYSTKTDQSKPTPKAATPELLKQLQGKATKSKR